MVWSVSNTNPRVFTITPAPPRQIGVTQENERSFSIEQKSAKEITLEQINARQFGILQVLRPADLTVFTVTLDKAIYEPYEVIICTLNIDNSGDEGTRDILWELVDETNTVINGGTISSGLVPVFGSAEVVIPSFEAPAVFSELTIRAKISGDTEWTYSEVSVLVPCDLDITAVSRDTLYYTPGGSIVSDVNITNSGEQGSETIEWQVVKASDLSVLSSGSQGSGVINRLGSGVVSLNGITAPDIATSFYVRARISGDAEWITADMAYSAPTDLEVLSLSTMVFWDPNTVQDVDASVHNSGVTGSQTIEWQVVKASDLSVYSEGTTVSGNIPSASTATVHLTGISSPDIYDTLVKVRARVIGDSTWIYTEPILVAIATIPDNPTPRDLP